MCKYKEMIKETEKELPSSDDDGVITLTGQYSCKLREIREQKTPYDPLTIDNSKYDKIYRGDITAIIDYYLKNASINIEFDSSNIKSVELINREINKDMQILLKKIKADILRL